MRTIQSHKLLLFLDCLPTQDLPRRTTRVHEEKLTILFRNSSRAIHAIPFKAESSQMLSRHMIGWATQSLVASETAYLLPL